MDATRTAALCLLFSLLGTGNALGEPSAEAAPGARILFLHHSTGACIWNGGVEAWIRAWNEQHGTAHRIQERAFPKAEPYGWENYPYDYWNLWVRHAGPHPHRGEPTLEMLAPDYDVIVFKHCFPVSGIEADTGSPDAASSEKRIENYELQYRALKAKLRSFPQTRFLVWTGAALTREETTPEAARRARRFFEWVRGRWDEPGDNVFVWDFFEVETEGGLYLQPEHAEDPHDPHPNAEFSRRAAPFFAQRVVDVAEGRGDTDDVTGRHAPALAPSEPDATTGPAPEAPPSALPSGGKRWVYENAESDVGARWGDQARAVQVDGGRALRIDFTRGRTEDWGEYGRHRLVETHRGAKATDVRGFRYLALRAKADRELLVPLALVTYAAPSDEGESSHFAFTAYLRLAAGDWRWLVFDLATLELAVEGAAFHEAAGKPSRPQALGTIRLALHADHEEARLLLDDLTFLQDLPAELEPFLQAP